MNRILFFAFCMGIVFSSIAQENMVVGNVRVHDPVMIEENGSYYIFCTGRGISILQSPDMKNWEKTGRVFAKDSLPSWHKNDIPEQDGHLWAPDISYRNGKYHLYYSVSAWMNFNSSIGYASNVTLDPSSPDYKWVDHGKVIDFRNGGEGVNVIDPMVYHENDRVWMYYGSYKSGLRLAELNPKTGLLKNDPPKLYTLTTSLGEGVFVLKTADYYYIFASRGICCKGNDSNYQVVMGRSKLLEGPFLNKKGESWVDNHYTLLMAGDEARPGRGHNGFFTQNDTTYIVYHAYTRAAEGQSLLNIQPLFVDEEGWPSIDASGEVFRREY